MLWRIESARRNVWSIYRKIESRRTEFCSFPGERIKAEMSISRMVGQFQDNFSSSTDLSCQLPKSSNAILSSETPSEFSSIRTASSIGGGPHT